MKIKVCGITQAEQLQQLHAIKVDYAGLIFYPGSKRFVGEKLDASSIIDIPINKVGVFVNQKVEDIMQISERYHLYAVQLHGDETAADCERLRSHFKVIKAIRINDVTDLAASVKQYQDVVDHFLFDNSNYKNPYGGSGEKFQWNMLDKIPADSSFFLSGGIAPDDAQLVNSIRHKGLYAVDINSRFEIVPGIKDMDLVSAFVRSIKDQK